MNGILSGKSEPAPLRLALIMPTMDSPAFNWVKPFGLAYLKSYLRRELAELSVDIYDDIDSLIQSRPDCVGISATTLTFTVAQGYIKRVQEELGCPVLLGGVHISLIPETLPQGVIACIGEGEETLTELMDLFRQRHVFEPEQLSKVKGIAFWDGKGSLVQTKPRDLILPLDRLPLPDRDAVGIKPGESDMLHMFTSRGCPYNCKFCVSRVHWKKYREFSTDYVLNEIEELVTKYGVSNIAFYDDLFIVNKKRLGEIVDRFAQRHCHIGTLCNVRANLVDDELCELLKKMNIREAMFGAESFSEPVLRELKSGSITVAQNQQALETLHKHGIKANVFMIFNAPEETREDMVTSWRAIFNNVCQQKINKVTWGLLIPYPGSGYWDIAVRKGICGIDMDWEAFSHPPPFHLNDNMTLAEAAAIINEWDTKCCLVNPRYQTEPIIEKYVSKEVVFVGRETLIKSICAREPKDETDTFVLQKYEQFLKRVADNKLVLSQGWEPAADGSWRWIGKNASFFVHSSIENEANLVNLVFFIPDIGYYPEKELTVTFKLGNNQNSLTVSGSGEYSIAVAMPSRSSGDFFTGEIACSADFCPAKLGVSSDARDLAVIISRFELARDQPANIVNVIRLPDDGQW